MPHPDRPAASRERTVPSWPADLVRATLYAAAIATGCTLLLLLASTGLLHHGRSGAVIAADATWAGILAGVGCVTHPFMQLSTTRPDSGFRRQGLPSLLTSGALLATAVAVAAMSTWHWLVGGRAALDAVISTLVTNPLSLALVAAFVLALHAWSATFVVGLARGSWKSTIAALIPLLALFGLGGWQGPALFANRPNGTALAVWSLVAVVGVAALATVSARLGPERKDRI